MGSCVRYVKPQSNVRRSSTKLSEEFECDSTIIGSSYANSRRKSHSTEFEANIIKSKVLKRRRHHSELTDDSEKTDLVSFKEKTLESQHKDYCAINIMVLGDKGVGKSTWVEKYVKNKFETYDVVSICLEEHLYEVKYEGKTYKLYFYIVPGDEQYQNNYKHLLARTDFFLVFFDITSRVSFAKTVNIVRYEIKDYIWEIGKSKNCFLISNKCDLAKTCVTNIQEVQDFCLTNSYRNISTSAKCNINIQFVVKSLVECLLD
jgi:Ras-related protein Rab-6A